MDKEAFDNKTVEYFNFIGKLKKYSIWNRVVPVNGSREMIAPIKEAAGNPRYKELAGGWNIIFESFENTEGLWDGVFAQILVGE